MCKQDGEYPDLVYDEADYAAYNWRRYSTSHDGLKMIVYLGKPNQYNIWVDCTKYDRWVRFLKDNACLMYTRYQLVELLKAR